MSFQESNVKNNKLQMALHLKLYLCFRQRKVFIFSNTNSFKSRKLSQTCNIVRETNRQI